MTMEQNKLITKKKFLGIIGVGFFTAMLGWSLFGKKIDKESGKIKMLTADGKLVEVDGSKVNLKQRAKPVSNGELKNWMKSKL